MTDEALNRNQDHDLPETYDSKHPFSVLTVEHPAKYKLSPNISSLVSLVADVIYVLVTESKALREWSQYSLSKAGLDIL